jgi:hypothetical protein
VRLLIAALLMTAGCSSQPADPTVVTSDEDRQLNDAAASLDANTFAPAGDNAQ